MIVHLIDGTYELFRHFYGLRRFNKGVDRPYGAVVGVLQTVLQMIEAGDTYLGVATDHVIESFRNRLWAGYKTGAGIETLTDAIEKWVFDDPALKGAELYVKMVHTADGKKQLFSFTIPFDKWLAAQQVAAPAKSAN